MSVRHRGGTGHADAFYSRFRRAWDCSPVRRSGNGKRDIRARMLAPTMDGDWWWYDGDTERPGLEIPSIVACIDTKMPSEEWTLDPPFGNGLQAMANLGPAAFVLEIDISRLQFTFYALNRLADAALQGMEEWCKGTGRNLLPIERRRVGGRWLRAMTMNHHGYWHFEMLTRARFRGEAEHDVTEAGRRLHMLCRLVPLPQQPGRPTVMEPFKYGPEALAQRRLGVAAGVEPITFHVAQVRELLQVAGREDLISDLDELERQATIIEQVERKLTAKERRLMDGPDKMTVREALAAQRRNAPPRTVARQMAPVWPWQIEYERAQESLRRMLTVPQIECPATILQQSAQRAIDDARESFQRMLTVPRIEPVTHTIGWAAETPSEPLQA